MPGINVRKQRTRNKTEIYTLKVKYNKIKQKICESWCDYLKVEICCR